MNWSVIVLAWALLAIAYAIGVVQPKDVAAQIPEGYVEYISKPHRIDNVMSTFYWFETIEELQAYTREKRVRGWSECETYLDHNFAHCDIFVVEPTTLDDDEVTTIGHEVMHGIYGPNYHKVVK